MSQLQTALFAPGSSQRMMAKALALPVDAIILDLEDAVSPLEKDTAREYVVQTLQLDSAAQRWVRINPVGTGLQVNDLAAILPAHPDAIMVPKADEASLSVLSNQLEEFEATGAVAPPLIALVETCRGLLQVASIASNPRVSGLMLGAEDLTAELGISRTEQGNEIMLARQQLAIAARAYNRFAMDTPHLAIANTEALAADVATARNLGMTSKACIHPSQVSTVQEGFGSTAQEVTWAHRVLAALDQSLAEGRGACALDGKMIDAPVAAQARRILAAAPKELQD
ncbi:HpcH/HpaI aldolase/citrate lyase family protein [Glutamicibacter sp.]|jgi:Citrate lyase beta subunit|uniref:HpcH/HpaI aldolase/citrate lyase family protein n=1 Tax=Glutamicibacter sp. TaxID=1931995 RepID=UPI002B49DE4D|nr:CoA ester lyase [Glutamicibacter sp.]HJX79315.1 CoA ester lyase [Glutamicibacter sp.]